MAKCSAICVGMDVHKDSIDIALAGAGALGEVRHYGTIGGLAVLRRIVASGRKLHVIYDPARRQATPHHAAGTQDLVVSD